MLKGKRTGQNSTPSKQWKSVRSSEGSLSSDCKRTGTDLIVSTSQVPAMSQVNLPTKRRSRRKMDLPQGFPQDMNLWKKQVNKNSTSEMKVNPACPFFS